MQKAIFASAFFFFALMLLVHDVAAERVLVEFTSVQSFPLVASGDEKGGPLLSCREATRKRIWARAAAIATAREDLLASLGPELAAKVFGAYDNFPFLKMEIDGLDRIALLANPQVAALHEDRMRELFTASSLAYIGAKDWHDEGHTGEGTSVAILDTGIRYWNGFFGACNQPGAEGCRVKVFESFATLVFGSGNADPIYVANIEGHGTNVGGIVADTAPGTDLISLGVFAYYDPDPQTGFDGGVLASDGDVTAALDWVVTHRDEYNIVAANLSLGSMVDPDMTGYCSGWVAGPYSTAFANTRDAGVLPVVATGNDYVKTAVASPSCVAPAVRVGAGYDDPAYGYSCGTGPVVPGAVTCFSNSSSLVDLIAPGNDIDAGGLYGYSGTSMAAPHAAGVVALYSARFGTPPVWTLERIRADAVHVEERSQHQLYVHRYVRIGSREALLRFDAGSILESSFEGVPIPDIDPEGVEVSAEASCLIDACPSDFAGNIYLDLAIDHPGTGDLLVELRSPDGSMARRKVEDDEEIGRYNVNSILGVQHLYGAFDDLKGSEVAGTWKLRLEDVAGGRRGRLYRAALLIDSARVELMASIDAPEVARPDDPFDVKVNLANLGNLDIEEAALAVDLVESRGTRVEDSFELDIDPPLTPGSAVSYDFDLVGTQGIYEIVLWAEALSPPIPPGLQVDPVPITITYRTFASFEVDPGIPAPGEETSLIPLSRGIIHSYHWSFGDGAESSSPHPAHVWMDPGEYEVTLTVTGPDGTSMTSRLVRVEPPLARQAEFLGSGCSCSLPAGGGRGSAPLAAWLLAACILAGIFAAVRGRGRRRTITAAAALLFALLFATPACDIEARHRDASEDAEAVSSAPWVSLLDPPDPSIGDLDLYIMVSSEDSSECDISLEFRIGEGEFLAAAIDDPGRLLGAASSLEGVEYDFFWLSTQDVPYDAEGVEIRAATTCGGRDSLPVMSRPFSLLNFFAAHPGAVMVTEISAADQNVPGEFRSDYVEIRNTTGETISASGWFFLASSGGGDWASLSLDGLELLPGRRIVIAEKNGEVPFNLGLPEGVRWDVRKGGAVAIVADHQRGLDFVRWGGSPAIPPAGLGWVDDIPLPVPQTLTTINRADETDDTDRASDFCIGEPSPGEASPGCTRRPLPGDLLVTELDASGAEDNVELLNRSGAVVNLGGWVLLWDGGDLGSGEIPLGSHFMEEGGRIVLRDGGTAGLFRNGIMELGENLNIDGLIPTALALRSPYGEVNDFLAAGGSKVRWMDWTEEHPTPMPGPLTTLARRPGDPDTDSSADFCLTRPSLREPSGDCYEPMVIMLRINEVMPGRPDWMEIHNTGPWAVDLSQVYLSYTSPYYNVSVGDFRLRGTLPPGGLVVVTESDLPGVSGEILVEGNIALAPEGDGSVALRDLYGFGIDFVVWGEPPGTPLWPDAWSGLGYDTHGENDSISIQRRSLDAPDTDSRDDWCWARPSPSSPNLPCE